MRRNRRGSVLLLAIFFLVTLSFLGIAFASLMPTEMRAAGRQKLQAAAFYAADAGIAHAMAWMEKAAKRGDDPLEGGATKTWSSPLGEWVWTVTLTPDSQTPPNGQNSVKVYEIRSEARLEGRLYRTVIALARQETFARFAWFEDQRASNLWIPATLYRFDGPFHSNSRIRVSVPSGYYEQDTPPTFGAEVTVKEKYEESPDGVQYSGEPPYDAEGNPVVGRYERLYRDGRVGLRTGVNAVEMPTDSVELSKAAWGSSSPPPSAPGVHLGVRSDSSDTAGGVFIVGDVDSVVLAVEDGGNRSATIQQGDATVKVVETLEAPLTAPDGTPVGVGNTLVYDASGGFSIHAGLTNGTIYATGSIQSLKGTNKGKRTVAVDLAAQKDIVLGGHLLRADTPQGQEPTGSRDSLGVVGFKVRVPTSIPRDRDNPLDVYAGIFAGTKGSEGGLYIDGWDNYQGAGKLRLYGGLMQAYKPPWGYFSGSTLLSGVTLESHYDENLANSPPPFFPTIGKFQVVSYREEAGTYLTPEEEERSR